jgi:hypothetical protein
MQLLAKNCRSSGEDHAAKQTNRAHDCIRLNQCPRDEWCPQCPDLRPLSSRPWCFSRWTAIARKKPPAKSGAKETKSSAARAQGLDGKISLDNAQSATTNKAIPDLKQDANSDKGKPAAGDLPVGLDLHWSAANDPRLNPLSTTEAVDSVRRNQNQATSSPGNELDMGVKLPFWTSTYIAD